MRQRRAFRQATGGHSSQAAAPERQPARHPARVTPANDIPMLHKGMSVKLPYVTETTGTQGAEVIENTTWTLANVSYIPYDQAITSSKDGDTASGLGANALKSGDRYLVLGLTIDDNGPSRFDNNLHQQRHLRDGLPQRREGHGRQSGRRLLHGPASTRRTAASGPAIRLGHLLHEHHAARPDGERVRLLRSARHPSLLLVVGNAGTQSGKPILAIDPDNLVAKSVCNGTAAFC